MVKLSAAQARELAEEFYGLSKELGTYRFGHWDALSREERTAMEAMEWSLLNASSDYTGMAVEVALDDVAPVVKRVASTTRKMKAAIKKAKRVKKVLDIAAAAVKLTGAIVSGSPAAILSAVDRALRSAS
jgi:hypothetical protein